MDGITGSPTLGGVVLAASAAAGYAVYKVSSGIKDYIAIRKTIIASSYSHQVLFRKVIGDATYGQISLFFSMMGILNASLMWPLCLTLYLTGVETLSWERLSWPILLAASGMFLGDLTIFRLFPLLFLLQFIFLNYLQFLTYWPTLVRLLHTISSSRSGLSLPFQFLRVILKAKLFWA